MGPPPKPVEASSTGSPRACLKQRSGRPVRFSSSELAPAQTSGFAPLERLVGIVAERDRIRRLGQVLVKERPSLGLSFFHSYFVYFNVQYKAQQDFSFLHEHTLR